MSNFMTRQIARGASSSLRAAISTNGAARRLPFLLKNRTPLEQRVRTLTIAAEAAASGSTAASSPSTLDKVIMGGLLSFLGYSAWQVYSLYTLWPEPCEEARKLAAASAKAGKLLGSSFTVDKTWDGTIQEDRLSVKLPVAGANGNKGFLYVRAVKGGSGSPAAGAGAPMPKGLACWPGKPCPGIILNGC